MRRQFQAQYQVGYLVGLMMLAAAVYDCVLPLGRPNAAVPPNAVGTMPPSPKKQTSKLSKIQCTEKNQERFAYSPGTHCTLPRIRNKRATKVFSITERRLWNNISENVTNSLD